MTDTSKFTLRRRIIDLEEENEKFRRRITDLEEENEKLRDKLESTLPDNPYGGNKGLIKCGKCGKVQESGWQHCTGCGWNWGYHSDSD